MKSLPKICCLLATLVPGLLAAGAPGEQVRARNAVADFAAALKTELSAAMQAGGPLNAIEVCNTRAPAIAEAVSLDSGMQLARVSLRNRNPGNAPNEWQSAVLDDFAARAAAGEPLDGLSWQETAVSDGRREYRFMQAIPTASLCLACHGETIAPPVAEKIAKLYPEDRASGFREGDLRGAFVVTRSLD